MNMIKNNQGKYSDEDYQEILSKLKEIDSGIKNSKIYDFLSNRKEIKYTLNDLMEPEDSYEFMSLHLQITRLLEKYTGEEKMDTYRNYVTNVQLSTMYGSPIDEMIRNYEYKLNPFDDEGKFYHIENKYLRGSIYRTRKDFAEIAFLTEIVIEVGEINE